MDHKASTEAKTAGEPKAPSEPAAPGGQKPGEDPEEISAVGGLLRGVDALYRGSVRLLAELEDPPYRPPEAVEARVRAIPPEAPAEDICSGMEIPGGGSIRASPARTEALVGRHPAVDFGLYDGFPRILMQMVADVVSIAGFVAAQHRKLIACIAAARAAGRPVDACSAAAEAGGPLHYVVRHYYEGAIRLANVAHGIIAKCRETEGEGVPELAKLKKYIDTVAAKVEINVGSAPADAEAMGSAETWARLETGTPDTAVALSDANEVYVPCDQLKAGGTQTPFVSLSWAVRMLRDARFKHRVWVSYYLGAHPPVDALQKQFR